jgi:hypothetical protein
MTISYKACSRCKKPVSLLALPSISGAEGPYKIELFGLSVLVCEENHKRFVYPNLAMRLMDQLTVPEVSGLYTATKRGLFKKHVHCGKCGAELPVNERHSQVYRVRVPFTDIEPVIVTLSAPVLKCAQCGTGQLADEQDLMKYVFKSMVHAFRSADIHAE